MPNVALIKDDGLPLILPASSITAILTTKRAANDAHPEAKTVIFTTFKASMLFFLAQGAIDVAEEVASKMPEGKPFPMRQLGLGDDDAQFIDPSAITGVEGIKDGDDKFLRVYFTRHDGASIYADVNFDLLETLQELIPEGGE